MCRVRVIAGGVRELALLFTSARSQKHSVEFLLQIELHHAFVGWGLLGGFDIAAVVLDISERRESALVNASFSIHLWSGGDGMTSETQLRRHWA